MSRDLVLDVIARKNSKDLSTLADEFDKLARKTDDAGKKMHETGTFSQFLDEQLAKTKVQVQQLGEEFDRTGNKDVFAKLRGAQANLKSLERIKTDLAKALKEGGESGGDEAGRSFVERFRDRLLGAHDWGRNAGSGFTEGFTSGIKPGLIGAAIVAGATLAPGVVLAATGLAGLGLGIVGQLRNPAIKEAAGQTGREIMDALGRDTAPLEGPIISALQTIGHSAESALGQIDFGSMGKEIEALASGIGGLIDRAMPGFNRALEAAQPVIDTLAADLPLLGDAVSQMFEDFSKGGRGAQEGIHMLMATFAGLILIVGKVVEVAGVMTERIVAAGERISWWVAVITAPLHFIGGVTEKIHAMWAEIQNGSMATVVAARSLHGVSAAAREAEQAAQNMSAAFDKAFGSQMSVDQAATRFTSDLYGLKDALDSHNKSIDLNSAAGTRNREVIQGAIQDAKAHRDALIASAGGANASKAAIDAANATYATDIERLKGMYVAANGSARAFDDLAGTYNVDIVTRHTDIYSSDYQQHSRGEHAHGGSLFPAYAGGGNVFSVGEQGRELLTLPAMSAPAYVTPNSALNGAANRGGDGSVIGTLRVVHERPNGTVIREELVALSRQRNYRTLAALLPIAGAT